MKKPSTPTQTSSPATSVTPAFIQLGEYAHTIVNTSEILCVTRELIEVTDEKRDRYRGLITPYGTAYVITVLLKDGRTLTYKCITEEYQTEMFNKLNEALGTYVVKYPAGMVDAMRSVCGPQ